MIFKQRKEFFEEKKQDISEKLKYLGMDEGNIYLFLMDNYDFFSRITGVYKRLEKKVNKEYNFTKKIRAELGELKSLNNSLPRIIYN
jgi:hypothetical protein